MKVLEELGAANRPMIVVFNKIDKVEDESTITGLRIHFPDAHFISVHTGDGLPELLARMEELAGPSSVTREWRFPPEEAAQVARLYRVGQVREVRHEEADTIVVATVPAKHADELARFVQVSNPQNADPEIGDDTFLETILVKPTK